MTILYSVISRGSTILAKYAECVGNFAEVTEEIISKRIPMEDHKQTFTHGDFLIHYICERKIIYMCITDNSSKEYERMRAFLFLTDIKQKFNHTYGLQIFTAIAYAMNTEFSRVLSQQMTFFSQDREVDNISRVRGQIDELKDILEKNIENIAERGEKLELLVNKTENLSNNSVAFRKASRNLARQMFWKKMRLYVAVGLVILFIGYVIVSMACGGLAWQKCV